MQIANEFVVDAPLDRVWAYLLDVEKIAPCAPGAELTEVVDDRTWKGKVTVKVGPVGLSFAGTVVILDRNDQAHTLTLKADGREQRGKGAATALVKCRLEAVDGRTKVAIDTDLTIRGAVAQYGRGMVADVSERLTRQFADCLQVSIASEEPASAATLRGQAPAAGAEPVKGIQLGAWALWRTVVRFFRRLFGRSGR